MIRLMRVQHRLNLIYRLNLGVFSRRRPIRAHFVIMRPYCSFGVTMNLFLEFYRLIQCSLHYLSKNYFEFCLALICHTVNLLQCIGSMFIKIHFDCLCANLYPSPMIELLSYCFSLLFWFPSSKDDYMRSSAYKLL
jgi:hypothetical protein